MDEPIRFDRDWHVSSTFSDGTVTVAENVHAAEERGLRSLCVVDRVRRSTVWVRDLVDACSAADREAELEVRSGVEAEVLDTNGTLDVPRSVERVDHLFVVADRLPTPTGPVVPEVAREQIEAGELFAARAMEWLVRAYAGAMRRDESVVLARPFSILPRLGIDPNTIHPPFVRWLAGVMLETGACSEVNESWCAPSSRVVDCFLTAGVPILPASGARSPLAVGRFEWVPGLLKELSWRRYGYSFARAA
jgi:putative hydrolase